MRAGFVLVRSFGWKRRRTPQISATNIPSTKKELKGIILKALRVNYDSQVGKRGNRYQTVALGDIEVHGQRTGRSEILDQVSFEGKKVLDLGCNFGQISRGARSRGAFLVDGYEIDPFFLEIARAISAHEEDTRVSFFRRDIADPSSYVEHYDIVLAFSVWAFMVQAFEKIAGITDHLLIVETHELEQTQVREGHFPGAPPSPSLLAEYLEQASRWFPYHRILGRTDGQRRAVIAFAKDQAALVDGLRPPVS